MDMRKIERLIKLIDNSTVSEIEIKDGESVVRVSRASSIAPTVVAAQAPQIIHAASQPVALAETMPQSTPEAPLPADGNAIRSPMVGTFYSAASPDAADFVKVGDKINVGDTLCIVEAMKIMNQIEAEISGTIIEILLQSGEPVEYDQLLFIIK
jgi:acetyl-CoA carboxylase biotin carboxyl carrier protein